MLTFVNTATEKKNTNEVPIDDLLDTQSRLILCFGQAERTGFEPAEGFDPFTDLANRRFRPLSHRSVNNSMVTIQPSHPFVRGAKAMPNPVIVSTPARADCAALLA